MPGKKYTIADKTGKEITVFVRRDKRLKKSSRWQWEPDGTILLRVPYRLPNRIITQHIDQVAKQLEKRKKMANRRTDTELQTRAEYLNKTYFKGKIEWNAIRWVGNMNQRLGSCTTSGSTVGHIRISDKIKAWPRYVIDYVIAHELVHMLHANHSKEFWATLTTAYPKTERARGFIHGMGFAEGSAYEDGD
jgi:predicted metal-dependent hydrolase